MEARQDRGGNEEGETRGEIVHSEEVPKAAAVGHVWRCACWERQRRRHGQHGGSWNEWKCRWHRMVAGGVEWWALGNREKTKGR